MLYAFSHFILATQCTHHYIYIYESQKVHFNLKKSKIVKQRIVNEHVSDKTKSYLLIQGKDFQ